MNSVKYSRSFIFIYCLIIVTAIFRFFLLSKNQFSFMDEEFPYWIEQKDKCIQKSDKKEILFMGDSRMKAAVIPSLVSENAYNLAVGGSTAIESYYSLKRYLKNHPAPKMIITSFAGADLAGEGCFTNRDLYFHFLSLKDYLEIQYKGYKYYGWTYSQLKDKVIDTLKFSLFFPEKYSAACINSKFQRKEYNVTEYEKNKENKGYMYFGWMEYNNDLNGDAEITYLPDLRTDYYLHKFILLCKENDIPLYIEQAPMNPASYNKLFETGYYEKLFKYLNNLEIETKIVINKTIPCYEPEFFGDYSHLNAKGAERYSKEIKQKYGL